MTIMSYRLQITISSAAAIALWCSMVGGLNPGAAETCLSLDALSEDGEKSGQVLPYFIKIFSEENLRYISAKPSMHIQ